MKTPAACWLVPLIVLAGLTREGRSAPLPLSHADPGPATARLPVKEVTVFKDGHAFLAHEGSVPIDAEGEAVLDVLPTPVMGTFWAYAASPEVRLKSVRASQRRVRLERTALTLRELLEANPGAEVWLTETNGLRYPATILGFPTRSPEELAATSPPSAARALPLQGNLVLLKTVDGTKALPVERLQDVTFKDAPQPRVSQDEFRAALTLRLDAAGRTPDRATLGYAYLQRGIRWIPSYRVDLDGRGQAQIRLQATVLNELTDLTNVTLHLVIGVPSFTFKDQLDPIALEETAAQLSAFFRHEGARSSRPSAVARNFDNSLVTQVVRMGGDTVEPGPTDGPDLREGTQREDLFVFTLEDVSLQRGERLVLPIADFSVPYDDVFVLELPFAPPPEIGGHLRAPPHSDLARLFSAPKVQHKARLHNRSRQPLTTAPALVLREGRLISQGLMTYAAIGASTDLTLTAAVDLQVKKTDREIKRTPNALHQSGESYLRVDLQGTVRLTNRRGQPVTLEVTRHVLGHADTADHNGTLEMSNVFESRDHLPAGDPEDRVAWWSEFNWPWWWYQVNGVGRIAWTVPLPPGQAIELGYTWHYFWR